MRHALHIVCPVAALWLGACGAGAGNADKTTAGDAAAGETATGNTGSDAPADAASDASDRAAGCNPNWILEIFNFIDGCELEVGRKFPVQARMYNSSLNTAVADRTVTFALSGSGDASLVDAEAVTDEFGIASATIDAGSLTGIQYTVTVSDSCAGTAQTSFVTIPPQKGAIAITVAVPPEVSAVLPDPTLHVFVDTGTPLCAAVDFTDPPGMEFQVPAGPGTVLAPDLLVGPPYLATAVAVDAGGAAVAGACEQKIVVMAGVTTDVTLTLELLAQDPAPEQPQPEE